MMQEELLFDLMESEADKLYYIIREGRRGKKAAILIISSPIGHFPKKRGDKYTVWFGRGIERWTFKTLNQAEEKVEEILAKASTPITVEITDRRGRKKYRSYGEKEEVVEEACR